MLDIALKIELAAFALGWRGQGDDAENPRADALGYRFDGAAFAGAIATLEDDAYLKPFMHDPPL